MLQLNLFDNNFRHLHNDNGEYSMVHEKIPRYIRYVRDLYDYDGITIFTDQFLEKDFINEVNSKYKIGWIIECRNISPQSYENFENYMDSLDFVLTHDAILLENIQIKLNLYHLVVDGLLVIILKYIIKLKCYP